jgi:hypothetical protein
VSETKPKRKRAPKAKAPGKLPRAVKVKRAPAPAKKWRAVQLSLPFGADGVAARELGGPDHVGDRGGD